eukprot:m.233684 g.233684  ORF g.233684 m.233684 type:complete len:143 (+) comp54299_c0_seq14:4304-4732(+)
MVATSMVVTSMVVTSMVATNLPVRFDLSCLTFKRVLQRLHVVCLASLNELECLLGLRVQAGQLALVQSIRTVFKSFGVHVNLTQARVELQLLQLMELLLEEVDLMQVVFNGPALKVVDSFILRVGRGLLALLHRANHLVNQT